MKVRFYKYQAAGNDFVVTDNRDGKLKFTDDQIRQLCDRRFGIGGDGLILLEHDDTHPFRMVYHNSDASISFCGNGCRAAVDLANRLGAAQRVTTFVAHDGPHEAEIFADGRIAVSLADIKNIERKSKDDFYIFTGTDHNVRFVKDLANFPVAEQGRSIRYSEMYQPRGTNADFVELGADGSVSFRIYERGVEAETLSSGSGAAASALVAARERGLNSPVTVKARGGTLQVEFTRNTIGQFTRIRYIGPVQMVFETTLEIA